MACGGSSRTFSGWAWTTGSTTTVFVPLTEPMLVANVEAIRVELELRNRSGDIQVKRAVQYSDDGITWGAAAAFDDAGGWIATEGFHLPSDYTDLTDRTKRHVRFGVLAQSSAAADNEQARVTYLLDIKSR